MTGNSARYHVHKPETGHVDYIAVERALASSVPRLDIPALYVGAPAIWDRHQIADRPTRWLETKFVRSHNVESVGAVGGKLVLWLNWLDDHGFTPEDVHLAASEALKDPVFRAYEAHLRFPADGSNGIAKSTWHGRKTAIRQYHDWLNDHFDVPKPYVLEWLRRPDGRLVLGIRDAGQAIDPAPNVRPLMPDAVDKWLLACHVDTPTGQPARNPQRDHAAIALLLATGLRITPASLLTTFEIPPASGHTFDAFQTPAAINKYGRGGVSHAFTTHLDAVRLYIIGDRQTIVDTKTYTPDIAYLIDPDNTDENRVTYTKPDGTRHTSRWNNTIDIVRLRLINPDGSSPLIFLQSTGRPLAAGSLAKRISIAAQTAYHSDQEPKADGTFPSGVTPHCARHTYATNLAALYLRGDPDLYWRDEKIIRFNNPEDAVKFVQHQVHHTTPGTTRIYTQHLSRLAPIASDTLKGR